jgi:hypothetical protein
MHIKQIVRKIENYIVDNKLDYKYNNKIAIYFDDNLKRIFNKVEIDIYVVNKIINDLDKEIERDEDYVSLRLKENKESEESMKLKIQNDIEYIDNEVKKNPKLEEIWRGYIYYTRCYGVKSEYLHVNRFTLYVDFKKQWHELLTNKFKTNADNIINEPKTRIQDCINIQDKLKKYTHNFNDIDMYLEMSGHLTPVLKQELTDTLNKISNKIDNVKSLVSFSNDAENELIEVNKLLKELEEMYNSK